MKKFNKVITVEVPVDEIANQLLGTFKEDFKHAEIVTESIIGNLLNKNRISDLYNNLNGYVTDLDFAKDDIIECTSRIYDYIKIKEDYRQIGICKVIDVDKYKDQPIKIEYQQVRKDGNVELKTTWVCKDKCKGTDVISVPALVQQSPVE